MTVVIGDSNNHFGLYHLDIFSPQFLFNRIHFGRQYIPGHKNKIKFSSLRFYVFKEKGLRCVNCGVEAIIVSLDAYLRQGIFKDPHFNFYGLYGNGEVFMLTKDHIIPISMGGKNKLENLQPMCNRCNGTKRDRQPLKIIENLKSHIGKECHIELWNPNRRFIYKGTTNNKHILIDNCGQYVITTKRLLYTKD